MGIQIELHLEKHTRNRINTDLHQLSSTEIGWYQNDKEQRIIMNTGIAVIRVYMSLNEVT